MGPGFGLGLWIDLTREVLRDQWFSGGNLTFVLIVTWRGVA